MGTIRYVRYEGGNAYAPDIHKMRSDRAMPVSKNSPRGGWKERIVKFEGTKVKRTRGFRKTSLEGVTFKKSRVKKKIGMVGC